jgi:hypothetical protein
MAADPANQASAGEDHVVVAGPGLRRRAATEGIYHGAPSVAKDVTVEVSRPA